MSIENKDHAQPDLQVRARTVMLEIMELQRQHVNSQMTQHGIDKIRSEMRAIFDWGGLDDLQFWIKHNYNSGLIELGFPRMIDAMAAEGLRLLAAMPVATSSDGESTIEASFKSVTADDILSVTTEDILRAPDKRR